MPKRSNWIWSSRFMTSERKTCNKRDERIIFQRETRSTADNGETMRRDVKAMTSRDSRNAVEWGGRKNKNTQCPHNWVFERIGVWTNTGRPFKQAAGSCWPFCVSKAAGRCQHLMAVASVGLLSQLGAEDYLNTPPDRPSLLSFPASHLLPFISCISCLFFIRSRTLFFRERCRAATALLVGKSLT